MTVGTPPRQWGKRPKGKQKLKVQYNEIGAAPILSDGRSEIMVHVDTTSELGHRPHPLSRPLRDLADWGMEETQALTLGELIQEIMVSQQANPAWDEITSIPLSELATLCPSALDVLEEWARGLTEMEQSIFWNRMAPRDRRKTLQELAWDHQKPYTTTWETEKHIYAKLMEFMETDEGASLKRRVQIIGKRLGVAQREQDADRIPDLDPDTDPHRELMLRLAGPYRIKGEWLALESKIPTDPTEELVRRVDQDGTLDEQLASASLEQWGLAPERHRDWITRDGRVKELRRGSNNLSDRAESALNDLGHPATPQEIQEHLGEEVSIRSIHVALSRDKRLMNTGPRLWGLSSWNLTKYVSIAHHMREMLEERGEMPVDELLGELVSTFGAKPTTIKAVARSHPFVINAGMIRMRREEDPITKRKPGRLQSHGGKFIKTGK